MVSVIVLTYNHEAYIAKALDSILMQETGFDYEILVGDDGSADGTRSILRHYAQQYPNVIRLFLREENLGAARNAYELLLQAKGKYLAFCEGDDYWTDPDKLAQQVDFLEKNPAFIGCTHRCVIVDENGKAREDQRLNWVRERSEFTLKDFRGLYLPGQTATIVKHNLFLGKERPYTFLYELNKNISDRTSTLLYLTRGSFGLIPKTMSAYRRVAHAGITNQVYEHDPDRILKELEYTRQLEALAKTLTSEAGIFDDYYQQLYAWAVCQFLKNPSKSNRRMIPETAKQIGYGPLHPIAFLRGMLQRKGIL